MIVTDQEQGIASYPKGLLEKLPAHRELMERGMLVENYHVHTTPCTPSRSTIFQGHHTQQTGLFLEPGVQLRLFLASNVAISAATGIAIGLVDADGVAITGQTITGGIHYYFF